MAATGGARFPRERLKARYAVAEFEEDPWHRHSDRITAAVIEKFLVSELRQNTDWVLNAGSGVATLGVPAEVSVDLFAEPVAGKKYPVCANVSQLPFSTGQFRAIVCVGEVLAYCDPDIVLREFARVLRPGGRLILDFGSTRSWRVFGSSISGTSAALLTSEYNGSAEKTWIYDPEYIRHVLKRSGFNIVDMRGAHYWSPLMRRLGVNLKTALKIEEKLSTYWRSARADTITIVSDLPATS